MATPVAIEAEQMLPLNLEQIVEEATWKDLLIDLVKRNKLDPWNIDLLEVVSKYIEAVRVMKILDLRTPANIMLAASILLRMKSEMISFIEEQMEMALEEPMQRTSVAVEPISFKLRVPPRRKITLTELINALEEAIKIKETRLSFTEKGVEMPLSINAYDLEEDMKKIYDTVKHKSDKLGMITFSALHDILPDVDMLTTLFISLLFLAHRGKIGLVQEQFFGEIIVSIAK
jgi:segregation and condensation protein A